MSHVLDRCKLGRDPRIAEMEAEYAEGATRADIFRKYTDGSFGRSAVERHMNGICSCFKHGEKPVFVTAEKDMLAAHRQRAQIAVQRQERQTMTRRILELEDQVHKLRDIDAVTVSESVPPWDKPKSRAHQHVGIANMVLSDLHLDEVVNPDQVQGMNKYNREIAQQRLDRLFENFFTVTHDHITGINYEGVVIPFLGDTFSGNIHEELKETNEVGILESLEYWIDPFVAYFKTVADEFKHLHIPVTVGNHGRLSRKPQAKNRVPDNYDWFFARQLARALRDDPRITWQIEMSPDCMMTQYGTTFLYTHGDQFRGGSGIAGLLSPLMLGDARKRKRQNAVGKPYDVMVFGHWHTYLSVPSFGLIGNGSLKGYDEYAYTMNFGYEVPQQAFWVTTPEHGVTFSAPILSQNRDKEGW